MEMMHISRLNELDRHLDDLVQDPSLELDAKLFDHVELQLTETNIPPLTPLLLPRLTAILKQYTQDPAVIASLTIKLLKPVPFANILQLASPDELVQALDSPARAANLLAMTVLHKAAASPADVALLALHPHLVAAFIRRWLAAPQVEVGQTGGRVLGDLLDIDCQLPPPLPPFRPEDVFYTTLVLRKAPGKGALWHLLFTDAAIYTLLLDLISGRHPDTAGNPHQLSLAQGRVLRTLPRLASLNFAAVSQSNITPPLPAHHGNGHSATDATLNGDAGNGPQPPLPNRPPQPGEGLLQYAALRMVNRSDELMHRSLVDFFEALVSRLRVTDRSPQKIATLRTLLAEATAGDEVLREALASLHERTEEEEEQALKAWVAELLPPVNGDGDGGLVIR